MAHPHLEPRAAQQPRLTKAGALLSERARQWGGTDTKEMNEQGDSRLQWLLGRRHTGTGAQVRNRRRPLLGRRVRGGLCERVRLHLALRVEENTLWEEPRASAERWGLGTWVKALPPSGYLKTWAFTVQFFSDITYMSYLLYNTCVCVVSNTFALV